MEEKLKERNKEETKVNGVKENGTENKENQPEKPVSNLKNKHHFLSYYFLGLKNWNLWEKKRILWEKKKIVWEKRE